MIEKIYEEEFAQYVLQADYPVVVDFYADWCGPCKMLAPILEGLSEELDDVVIAKINVDDNPGLASAFRVSAIPTLVVMKDGTAKAKEMGMLPKSEILKMLGK